MEIRFCVGPTDCGGLQFVSIAALDYCEILAEALLRISGFMSIVLEGRLVGLTFTLFPFLKMQHITIKCNDF